MVHTDISSCSLPKEAEAWPTGRAPEPAGPARRIPASLAQAKMLMNSNWEWGWEAGREESTAHRTRDISSWREK